MGQVENSLEVQWVGLFALSSRAWVQSLAGELRSHRRYGAVSK